MTKYACFFTSLLVLLIAGIVSAQDYPILDMVANNVIEKYQNATCEQLWQEKAQRDQTKTPQQQEAINFLRSNPEMRTVFINKIAAPVANKMFECGMIP